jgi:glycosyltransferase involved in cell wall biosynthesis
MVEKILDIIMPVYNEAASIEQTLGEIADRVLNVIPGSRLLAIDDGSRDDSGSILDAWEKKHPSQMKVFHKSNSGHGASLLFGLERAEAEWIFLLDSDNQIAVNQFLKLWERRRQAPPRYQPGPGQADLLMGRRARRQDPQLRIWLTRFIRLFLWCYFGVKVYDANVPFKLFKRSLWEKVKIFIPPDTLAPSLFLAVIAKKLGYSLLEIEVEHSSRKTGSSSLKKLKLFRFCLKALRQLLALRRALASTSQK